MSLVELSVKGDHRGSLVAIEQLKDIPFEIKRTFHIFGTKLDTPRGQHAHFVTKQFLVAVNGRCKVTLDDGKEKREYSLNHPGVGLLQEEMVWGEMHDFSEDCVLLVLASEYYAEQDYIRNYDEFLKAINK